MSRGYKQSGASFRAAEVEKKGWTSTNKGGWTSSNPPHPRKFYEGIVNGMAAARKRLDELKGTGRSFDIMKAMNDMENLEDKLFRYGLLKKGFRAAEETLDEATKRYMREADKSYKQWKAQRDKDAASVSAEFNAVGLNDPELDHATLAPFIEHFDEKVGEISKSNYRLAKAISAISKAEPESSRRIQDAFSSENDSLKKAERDGEFAKTKGVLPYAYEAVAKHASTIGPNLAIHRSSLIKAMANLDSQLKTMGVLPKPRTELLARMAIVAQMHVVAADDEGRKAMLKEMGY